jgi:homoserine dehydrogenase
LQQGFHVALANKKPLAIPHEQYQELFDIARQKKLMIRYEATVGAGLPVLDTLAKLAAAGDPVETILGCLSGTLGYIMTSLEEGMSFSQAVRTAYERGYTEPDPREDLTGMDVARKALILARTLGYARNMEDIQLTPLFSAQLSSGDPQQFLANLAALDEVMTAKVAAAKEHHAVLRYVARIDRGAISVGIEEVAAESPLGRLRGTANQVIIKTRHYHDNPLVVTGPGAGAHVTAAGVLNDIVAIATSFDLA